MTKAKTATKTASSQSYARNVAVKPKSEVAKIKDELSRLQGQVLRLQGEVVELKAKKYKTTRRSATKYKGPSPAQSDQEKYGILPGDNWLIQVHKIAQSVGGFDFEIPRRK